MVQICGAENKTLQIKLNILKTTCLRMYNDHIYLTNLLTVYYEMREKQS